MGRPCSASAVLTRIRMPLVGVAGASSPRAPLRSSFGVARVRGASATAPHQGGAFGGAAALVFLVPDSSRAQEAQPPQTTQAPPTAVTITCASTTGERNACSADTSAGVVLMRSTGQGPCLLGKTWGYDQTSIWVSEGCSGEFVTGRLEVAPAKPAVPRHLPNVGFLLFDGDKGQIYFRLFSYGRYLNQRNLDESYVDAFGHTKTAQHRQHIQLQKFFSPFSGWFLTPKFRYYLYVWSSNSSQGDPAQVVGA